MGMVDKQWEFLKDVSLLIQFADRKGIVLSGGELYRTRYQQRRYIEKGLSKTMNSKHLKRMAIDFNFFIDSKLTYKKEDVQELGDFWESLNPKNKWGGNFKSFTDTPHFERIP